MNEKLIFKNHQTLLQNIYPIIFFSFTLNNNFFIIFFFFFPFPYFCLSLFLSFPFFLSIIFFSIFSRLLSFIFYFNQYLSCVVFPWPSTLKLPHPWPLAPPSPLANVRASVKNLGFDKLDRFKV